MLDLVHRKLDRLLAEARLQTRLLLMLSRKEDSIMATLADLQAAVAAEDTVIDSAIALISGLATKIAALPPTQEAIDALAADVVARRDALAAAVAAGTGAA